MKAKKVYEFVNPRERGGLQKSDVKLGRIQEIKKEIDLFLHTYGIEDLFKEFILKEDLLVLKGDILWNSEVIYKFPTTNFLLEGNFYAEDCIFYDELPNKFTVDGWVSLVESRIKELPDEINVTDDLILRDTEGIKKLPGNIKVDGNLNLINCSIEEIPESLMIPFNKKILLSGTHKIKIPDKFRYNIKIEW